ncbi:MAG: hypothetical protein ACYS8W_04815 [Planctomycetota bacterium]|jgi:hypothetical protein
MADESGLIPVLHLTDEALADEAIARMSELGFRVKKAPVADVPDSELPDWYEPQADKSGWFFFLEKDRFEEAMTTLGGIMGCVPDE